MSAAGPGARVRYRQRSPPGAWRLLFPAVAVWACAAWAVGSPGSGRALSWIALLLGSACCLVALLLRRGRLGGGCPGGGRARPSRRTPDRASAARRVIGAALVLCALGLLIGVRIGVQDRARGDPELAAVAAAGGAAEYDVVLTGFPQPSDAGFGVRFWARADLDSRSGPVPVLLWMSDPPGDDWAPGARLRARGALRALEPGGPAFAVEANELHRLSAQTPIARLGELAATLRMGLRGVAARVPQAALVPGFAVGDTALVDDALNEVMSEASLTHLTAVSGDCVDS